MELIDANRSATVLLRSQPDAEIYAAMMVDEFF